MNVQMKFRMKYMNEHLENVFFYPKEIYYRNIGLN